MVHDNNHTNSQAVASDGRDVVVIGGSSGSFSPLWTVLQALPPDLPASIFVVLHLAVSGAPVTDLVRKSSPFPVRAPRDGEVWRAGTLYVATPNDHLMFDAGGVLRVLHGPRENGARPSIDALFRSAAVQCGPRVVGLLLSGRLFDGAAGLRAIERCGGVTIVQDPADAVESELPMSALSSSRVDHCLRASEIGAKVVELVRARRSERDSIPAALQDEARLAIAAAQGARAPPHGRPSLTCPACDGPLSELGEPGAASFRCEMGHAYNPDSLLVEQAQMVERALWVALRTLQERSILLTRMAGEAQRRGYPSTAAGYDDRREEIDEHVRAIRQAIGIATSEIAPPIAKPAAEG